jgi:hypothetical protein
MVTAITTTPRTGLRPIVGTFLLAFIVAAVPYVAVGAIFRGPVYDQFDDVTTWFKITFWAFYVAQVLASVSLCIIGARMLRLALLAAVLGAVCFLGLAAWPTFYTYSVATSCELGPSYPLPGIEACR